MKPLSAFKFFSQNKKKAIIILVVLFTAVLAISFIASLVETTFSSSKEANIAPLKKLSYVFSPNGEMFLKEDVVKKVKEFDTIDSVYSVYFRNTSIDTLMGNTSSMVTFINNNAKMKEIMDKCGLKLTKGVLPEENQYEVIMHESMMRNKDLKIGDYFGDEVDEKEWVTGKYKIVGSFEGESMIAFGTKNCSLESLKLAGVDISKSPMALLAFPKNNDIKAMNKQLETLTKKDATFTTKEKVLREFEDQMKNIYSILSIIIVMVVIGMSIAVGALMNTIYSARSDEFGILYAIGYSKKNVSNLIFKEIGFISVICWGLGYLGSLGVLKIFDGIMMAPLGLSMVYFSTKGFLFTLFVPACVFIFASFPIIRKLYKTDLVSIIERRA